MDGARTTKIEFTMASPLVTARVDVRLRADGDRWVAVASADGASETAIAPTARLALTAALAFLPDEVVRALLADVALYGPSAEIVRRRSRPA